ncbi:bromodomain-containing protein 4 isoform X2 [Helianthus annuus]|uniref:bromodomain-containing protein 4 isoform X2 n=1 Tax=Helianthus annuus TaxID=4232 RepID=UPI000B8F3C34|nr:bromodomain-containing protein 4 isoform X2 [Helianthus annuus]
MTEEDAGASPPTPKKFKTDSEKQPVELSKDKSHPEEEDSKEIEEDEDDDGPPPGWRHSPTSSPPLLDMIDFPPSLTLPPTPPLPSSPTDLEMEQQDSDEDDGPPPGWDTKYQVNEQAGQLAATSAISSDIQTEDVQQAAHDEEGEPRSQAHSCLPPEVAPSVEEQEQEHDSEDDGPPPGWDSKCQHEPKLQEVPQSDTKMEDVLQDAHNEEGQPTPEVPSDIIADPEDSDDEGPPPGWDSKCQPEPESQKTLQSDSSDIKTNHVQQDAQNENDPQSQSQPRSSPAPELVPSVEEQDSEDDGPPPGWNSKCPVEPNLQTAGPTTPPSDFKTEEDKEQSHVHSSLPSPIVQSGTGHEPNNVKTIEEIPQPPSRHQSIHHTAEITVPKRPTTMNNHEMGQMVCGSCRHLLSYPRGARYVECACCLVENYVLEEHEVGQVVCGSCNVLLMYPYGAPKVRCATCRAETEIGDQNRRPPLSEHKRRARQHLKRVQAG